ncbi:hypothetical protein J6590_106134 [Homalodisca vitripennis]|nr:hypothetical protein J6590_106134 [Homalodisca vitripennis]
MPADRVFGRVEKLLRKQPTMSTKEDYYTVYQSVGEVRKLGDEWSLVNTKCLSSRFRNVDHISEKKRIFLKKGKAVVEKTTGRREVSTVKVKSTDHFRFQSDTEQLNSLQKKDTPWPVTLEDSSLYNLGAKYANNFLSNSRKREASPTLDPV